MTCPVCVVGGVTYYACMFFGVPDVVSACILGMLTTSLAFLANKKLNASSRWKKQPFQLVFLQVIFGVNAIMSLKLYGMW